MWAREAARPAATEARWGESSPGWQLGGARTVGQWRTGSWPRSSPGLASKRLPGGLDLVGGAPAPLGGDGAPACPRGDFLPAARVRRRMTLPQSPPWAARRELPYLAGWCRLGSPGSQEEPGPQPAEVHLPRGRGHCSSLPPFPAGAPLWGPAQGARAPGRGLPRAPGSGAWLAAPVGRPPLPAQTWGVMWPGESVRRSEGGVAMEDTAAVLRAARLTSALPAAPAAASVAGAPPSSLPWTASSRTVPRAASAEALVPTWWTSLGMAQSCWRTWLGGRSETGAAERGAWPLGSLGETSTDDM